MMRAESARPHWLTAAQFSNAEAEAWISGLCNAREKVEVAAEVGTQCAQP